MYDVVSQLLSDASGLVQMINCSWENWANGLFKAFCYLSKEDQNPSPAPRASCHWAPAHLHSFLWVSHSFPQLGDLALKSSPSSLFSFFRPQLERHFFFLVLFIQLYCDLTDRKQIPQSNLLTEKMEKPVAKTHTRYLDRDCLEIQLTLFTGVPCLPVLGVLRCPPCLFSVDGSWRVSVWLVVWVKTSAVTASLAAPSRQAGGTGVAEDCTLSFVPGVQEVFRTRCIPRQWLWFSSIHPPAQNLSTSIIKLSPFPRCHMAHLLG